MKPIKSLDKLFNIQSEYTMHNEVITASGEVITPELTSEKEMIDYDYERTRNNLHSLLHQGQVALEHALEVAKQSEHPRAFEVVGNLVKQLADVNHQLLDLTTKKQRLNQTNKQPDSDPTGKTVNNAIFVGSTLELKNMLKDLNN